MSVCISVKQYYGRSNSDTIVKFKFARKLDTNKKRTDHKII